MDYSILPPLTVDPLNAVFLPFLCCYLGRILDHIYSHTAYLNDLTFDCNFSAITLYSCRSYCGLSDSAGSDRPPSEVSRQNTDHSRG